MRIEQYVTSLSFFEKDFKNRWNFSEYYDTNKPLFFFGFNGLSHIFENHNSYKIILPSTYKDLPDFNQLKNTEKTILIIETNLPKNYFIPDSVIVKKLIIEIKDYSIFKPNKLGDKIYYYSGFSKKWSPNNVKLINEIQKEINFEIITTNHFLKSDMYDIEYLKQSYYDKCFVNLNFTRGNGMTTVRELALMGRKTITSNNPYNYDCLIRCDDKESIIKAIIEESKKINTIQSPINVHNSGEEWTNLDYLIKV